MLNRDDEKENPKQNESEYHFSDEDISYEVDEEESTTPTGNGPSGPKSNILKRLIRSRVLISFAIFLVLVFIVYKLFLPATTTAPSTITPELANVPNATTMTTAAPGREPQVAPSVPVVQTPPPSALQPPVPQQPSFVET